MSERGSAFIEAIVAAAIISLSLAGTYRVLADNARRSGAADDKRMATMIAQSELASVGSAIPLSSAVASGADGAFVWNVKSEPYQAGGGANPAGALWLVTVSVSRQGGARPIETLRSLKLVPAS